MYFVEQEWDPTQLAAKGERKVGIKTCKIIVERELHCDTGFLSQSKDKYDNKHGESAFSEVIL